MPPTAVPDGVEFVYEEDGRVTARHTETNVASFGDTESEALRELADALETYRDGDDPIENPQEYLDSRGIDAEIGENGPPPWIDDT